MDFYRDRGSQTVRLNRKNNPLSPTGRYCCTIPDVTGIMLTLVASIIEEGTFPTPPTITCPTPSVCATPELVTTPIVTCPEINEIPNPLAFKLGDTTYPNNTVILLKDIGEGDSALLCVSNNTGCCIAPSSDFKGEFYYPNNTLVPIDSVQHSVYRNRGSGFVRLNQQANVINPPPLGKYRCDILDDVGVRQSLFINIAIDCGNVPALLNGEVAISSTTLGSKATYSCNAGYDLVGVSSRTCPSSGQWSVTAPVCIIALPLTTSLPTTTTTSLPQSGNNLNFELKGVSYANGSTVSLEDIGEDDNALLCRTDRTDCCTGDNRDGEFYYPDGSTVGIKSENGPLYRNRRQQAILLNHNTSSINTPPTGRYHCKIPNSIGEEQTISINIAGTGPECPQLGNLDNGQVTVSTSPILPGSSAVYTCNTGYQLGGSSVRQCQNNGTWSGSIPTCEAISCTDLENPKNGIVTKFGNTPSSLALYGCNEGFQIESGLSTTRDCGADGQWSGVAPTCIVHCPPLEHPQRGLVTIDGDHTTGTMATYSCDGDLSLLGSSTRECQTDGTWSGSNEAPTCSNISFELNGEVYTSSRTISLSSIGEDGGALRCITDGVCCTNRVGEFFYPNGTVVEIKRNGHDLYRDRRDQMIRLHRRN